jgi:serine/threonine-protein kinase HipA
MTSEGSDGRAYVWTWLPGATDPVVAGVLEPRGDRLVFAYGRSYLDRPRAVPLFTPELPLGRGTIEPPAGTRVAGVIADAAPDAWGQRVILRRLTGRHGRAADPGDLGLLTYLLESGSDRTGNLDFQRSATEYVARDDDRATLGELAEAADLLDRGEPLPTALDHALLRGTSIGGARPKALLTDGPRRLIAKFASSTDTFPVVKAEHAAMRLAALAGLDVAPVSLGHALGRPVLLVERFDRGAGGERRAMVSALTILALDEIAARYASYADLALVVRERFTQPAATLRELFSRIVFNVLVGNTDDHARNHAAFWDGTTEHLTLTPAYDVCPQPRAGGEASQAMAIDPDGWRMSRLGGCVRAAAHYLLDEGEARAICDRLVTTIRERWDDVADESELTADERRLLWGRAILNPYVFEGGGRQGP